MHVYIQSSYKITELITFIFEVLWILYKQSLSFIDEK